MINHLICLIKETYHAPKHYDIYFNRRIFAIKLIKFEDLSFDFRYNGLVIGSQHQVIMQIGFNILVSDRCIPLLFWYTN